MTIKDNSIIDETTEKNIETWLSGNYDEETKSVIQKLKKTDPQKLVDAFYTNLSFGTGGLRGIMGVGSNRMNQYTVRAATQGFANYINLQKDLPKNLSVFIGYDSRNFSSFFAEEVAKVFAANGIKAYLSKQARSTPLVSFGCRYKKCQAAVVITASHNPPEYNGFKAYWSDGAQVLPPHDKGIINEVRKIQNPDQVKIADKNHALIERIGEEIDHAYLSETFKLQNYPELNEKHGHSLKIVYTNIHGTGITIVPAILEKWGFNNLTFVEEQKSLDGNFPTVKKPNPEEEPAMEMGIAKLLKEHGDILLGTDPDADRMGAIVLHKEKPFVLDGNTIACICLYHICEALSEKGTMPEKAAFIKTIVTTELFRFIAESYGKPCFDVLTGFKYIAELIRKWELSSENYQYIFGGEESYGYLFGTHARDKDAAISCALICEAALHAKLEGKTLVDILHEIYRKYGIYFEKLHCICFPESKSGKETLKVLMEKLRKTPPQKIGNSPVNIFEDYASSTQINLKTSKQKKIDLPKSNVLRFFLEDGSKITIRPSGTEPKIKIYSSVSKKDFSNIEQGIEDCKHQIEQLLKDVDSLLNK